MSDPIIIDLTNDLDDMDSIVTGSVHSLESPEEQQWQEGFCPTCCDINRIENSYCKYNCKYKRVDDIAWAEYNERNGHHDYDHIKYTLKGWEDDFCENCISKDVFDNTGYCKPISSCRFRIFDNATFAAWKANDGLL